MSTGASRTVYVGNLPGGTLAEEVQNLFSKYGFVVDVDLKIPPTCYAFVEFEDSRDAEDAFYGRDGHNFGGNEIKVELAYGLRRYTRHHYSQSGNSYAGSSRHSDYRDLKDHMRQAGDVSFSQVFENHGGVAGIVDYTNYDDMKYVIWNLDGSKFRDIFSSAYITVREYDSGRSYSGSPSSDCTTSSYRSRSPSPRPNYSQRSRSISARSSSCSSY